MKYDGICCPVNAANEVCNGRGACVSTSDIDPWTAYCNETLLYKKFTCPNRHNKTYDNKYCKTLNFLRKGFNTNQIDFRYNWPAQIFTKICKCTGNWAGYDCSRCKRGYNGTDCTEKLNRVPVVRRSFLDLSPSEKDRIIEILNMSKYIESDFTVPINKSQNGTYIFKALPLYDVFATFHYYTIRDDALKHEVKKNYPEFMIPDFAHEGPGFLPWHRAYLLYFETELQYMLNDHSFALPYWDWTAYNTQTPNNHECPDIFDVDLFGAENNCKNNKIAPDTDSDGICITSNKFKWTPVCVNYENLVNLEKRKLCDPNENDKLDESERCIKRCIGGKNGIQCRADGTLPTEDDVNTVNNELEYDVCGYDNDSNTKGFRNAIEGFYNFSMVYRDCGVAEMHNKVHLYIGGLMKDVPTSSNDPIFWLHHCNIDRLYENWLTNPNNTDTSYKPVPIDNSVEYIIGFGHNGNDNAGLLFPPITIVEAHKQASEFGYSYQDPISCTTDATPTTGSTPSTSENTQTSSSSSSMVSTASNPGGTTSNPGGTTSNPGGTTSNPGGTTSNTGGTTSNPGGTTSKPGGTNPRGRPTSGGVRSPLYQNYLVSLCSYITK